MTWSLIAAVNNESVLRHNLLQSPDASCARDVILRRGFANAGAAYNSVLAEARGDLLVFAHQDVYLPAGWIRSLEGWVTKVAAKDPRWAVLGVIGIDVHGEAQGRVYSTGLGRLAGKPLKSPVRVNSIDEMVIIVRRDCGLDFDPNLPGFHLYGTDICLKASERGLSCFVIDNFCLHNSNGIRRLPFAFWRSCAYLQAKWRTRLPLRTLCVTIRRGLPWLALSIVRECINPRIPGTRVSDPARLVQKLTVDAEPLLTQRSAYV